MDSMRKKRTTIPKIADRAELFHKRTSEIIKKQKDENEFNFRIQKKVTKSYTKC